MEAHGRTGYAEGRVESSGDEGRRGASGGKRKFASTVFPTVTYISLGFELTISDAEFEYV